MVAGVTKLMLICEHLSFCSDKNFFEVAHTFQEIPGCGEWVKDGGTGFGQVM